jgi:predicted nucleotidyltransferase
VKQLSTTREAVLQRLQLALPYLRRRYGVVRLALYGSFAQGLANEDSDVDLLVELSLPWPTMWNGNWAAKWIWPPLKRSGEV